MTYLPDTSALAKSVIGAKAQWTTLEYLVAAAVDALNAGNWQRGGGKGKRPKPVPRPGDRQARKIGGTTSVPLSKGKNIFERRNPAAHGVAAYQPPAPCSASECTGAVHARGMCGKHYQRWRRARQR